MCTLPSPSQRTGGGRISGRFMDVHPGSSMFIPHFSMESTITHGIFMYIPSVLSFPTIIGPLFPWLSQSPANLIRGAGRKDEEKKKKKKKKKDVGNEAWLGRWMWKLGEPKGFCVEWGFVAKRSLGENSWVDGMRMNETLISNTSHGCEWGKTSLYVEVS